MIFWSTKGYYIKFNTLLYYENTKKGELQQIVINHLSDNNFKDLWGFTKKVLRNRILF